MDYRFVRYVLSNEFLMRVFETNCRILEVQTINILFITPPSSCANRVGMFMLVWLLIVYSMHKR